MKHRTSVFLLAAAIALLGAASASVAEADTGLVMGCKDADSASKGSGGALPACATRQFLKLEAGAFVMSAAAQDLTAGKYWATESQRYRQAKDADAKFVVICSADVAVGSVDCSSGAWGPNAIAGASIPAPPVTQPVVGTGAATLTWNAVTASTDEKPITVAGYYVYRGSSATTLVQLPTVVSPNALRYNFTDLPVGDTYFAVSAYLLNDKAQPIEGGQSPVVKKNILAAPPPVVAPPKAPTNVKVEDTIAYDIVKATDKLTVKAVGSVPLGTNCLAATTAMGMYAVPRAKVAFASSSKPLVVFAKCS